MKIKNLVLLLLIGSSISVKSHAATWGVAELLEVSKLATDHLKEKLGTAAYESIQSFSVELNAQKVAGKAKITYAEQGQIKTVSYFCHEHGESLNLSIDCH